MLLSPMSALQRITGRAMMDYAGRVAQADSLLKSDIELSPKSAMKRHCRRRSRKGKSRPKAALNSNRVIMDHVAINAGFDFRR